MVLASHAWKHLASMVVELTEVCKLEANFSNECHTPPPGEHLSCYSHAPLASFASWRERETSYRNARCAGMGFMTMCPIQR